LSTARVYIWDHREATAAKTFCNLDGVEFQPEAGGRYSEEMRGGPLAVINGAINGFIIIYYPSYRSYNTILSLLRAITVSCFLRDYNQLSSLMNCSLSIDCLIIYVFKRVYCHIPLNNELYVILYIYMYLSVSIDCRRL